MATHSSILAWKIPWAEDPGGLLSMGLHKSDMTEHVQMMTSMNLFMQQSVGKCLTIQIPRYALLDNLYGVNTPTMTNDKQST